MPCVGAKTNEIILSINQQNFSQIARIGPTLIKTMTNGEYLRLCQKHGVAPIYLDDTPKRDKRKQVGPEVVKTFGDGFALVTPTKFPKQRTNEPLTKLAERAAAERGKKKSKRLGAKKRSPKQPRKHGRIHAGRVLELKRLERREARLFPRTASIETRGGFFGGRPVGGGLPGLGKRR